MGDCGLPGEFCFMNLRKGAKIIGGICALLSFTFSIMILIYLFTDFDAIASEISDNHPVVVENLNDTKTSKNFLLRNLNIHKFLMSYQL